MVLQAVKAKHCNKTLTGLGRLSLIERRFT
jgi:hypothetical protein